MAPSIRLKITSALLVVILAGTGILSHARNLEEEIDTVLALQPPPPGVVFEIVHASPDALKRLLPRVKQAVERLRNAAPKVEIAIVTHGNEQFALTQANQKKFSGVHSQVKDLVKRQGVDMHVCGAYAESRGVTPEEFPDYVDVSATGPAQIQNYAAMGYVVVPVD